MREFPTSVVRGREGGGMRNICGEVCSWELEGRSPSRPLAPVRSLNRVDTDPHAALRALLVGLRPPTPQSPERLRSTPFDCVAIAPCCFAKRKAVLSHALAALTALKAREKTGLLWKFRSQRRTCLTRARARPQRHAKQMCAKIGHCPFQVPSFKMERCYEFETPFSLPAAERAAPFRKFRGDSPW